MTKPVQNPLLKSLRREARRGQAQAQFALGKYYADHVSNPDREVGLHRQSLGWFLKAAIQGHVAAQYELGLIYAWGPAVLRDADAAIIWLRKATDQGNANALLEIGEYLYHRKKDGAGAIRCFEQAIALGYAAGYYSLGKYYEMGYGVESNKARATELYRKAAQLDHTHAQVRLGIWLTGLERSGPPPYTLSEGLHWLNRAVELGDVSGQHWLGRFYECGHTSHRDYKRAAELYRLAAEQGDIDDQLALGCMYRDGRGVAQDFAVALDWFRKAAARKTGPYHPSVAWAESYIGEMYLHGRGVAVDYAMALQCFTKAGKKCSNALLHLGVMYYGGKGVRRDYIQAKIHFIKSGHAEAKSWLARMRGVRLRHAKTKPGLSGTTCAMLKGFDLHD